MLRLLRRSAVQRYSAAYSIVRASSQSPTYILEDMVTTRKSRETTLKQLGLHEAITNIRRGCAAASPPQPVSAKHAAVLVPLFQSHDGTIHVILTQRSSKMATHAGEVCFPGGKRDPQDATDIDTALREAEEELGINPSCVNIVATLPPVLSKHLLSVTPVIATVPSDLRFTPNLSEVASVFTAPLDMFLSAGQGYSFRDLTWENHPYRIHAWDYIYKGASNNSSDSDGKKDSIKEERYMIWGLTAGMLILVAEKAFGMSPHFEVHPPGAPPYTSLAVDQGRLVFRGVSSSSQSKSTTQQGEKKENGPGSSAAVQGAMVMDEEIQAAVGCDESTG